MKFPSRQQVTGLPGREGRARVDRRTASVLRRAQAGDVAVIDHLDLDRATAQALVDAGVVAVVNASSFISGRYPGLGPELLASAGVAMVDHVGPEVFGSISDGALVRVHQGTVLSGEDVVATGRVLDPELVHTLMEQARAGLATQLESFTHNTTELLRREQELLLHGEGVPKTRVAVDGRPVVVVVAGYEYAEDLRGLRRYIREQRPVLIGVDRGADALLAAGHRPDLVFVGDQGQQATTTTASDRALRTAREVVRHTDGSGRATAADRLDRLGIRSHAMSSAGTTEDVAMLFADVSGASLIVAVGTHATLPEFLDGQRAGLASTFLTRLRVGPKLVEAKRVPQLYAGRVRLWHLLVVLLAGLLALGVAIAATPVGEEWWAAIAGALSDLGDKIQGLIS
jgi:uncharacterized membrane-anchored protein